MLCAYSCLTHWSRVTHICVGNLTTIASDNGLSLDRRQAIIWANAGILSIGHLGINFSEISMEIQTFSLWKMRLKSSSAKWRPSCLGFNVLTHWGLKQNWPIFCRRYLQAHFLVWKFSWMKICVFYWNFTEICCLGKPHWSKELLICRNSFEQLSAFKCWCCEASREASCAAECHTRDYTNNILYKHGLWFTLKTVSGGVTGLKDVDWNYWKYLIKYPYWDTTNICQHDLPTFWALYFICLDNTHHKNWDEWHRAVRFSIHSQNERP